MLFAKPTENKPIAVTVRIMIVLIVDIILNKVIPYEFLQFDHRGYFDKRFHYESFSFSDWFCMIWNRDIRELTIFLVLIVIVILLFFRFRFKKSENFRLTRRTVIIALLCFISAIVGYSFALIRLYQQGELHWESQIMEFLREFYIVGLLEEFGYVSK